MQSKVTERGKSEQITGTLSSQVYCYYYGVQSFGSNATTLDFSVWRCSYKS